MKRRSYHLTLLAAAAVAQAGMGFAQPSDNQGSGNAVQNSSNPASTTGQSYSRAQLALTQRLRRRIMAERAL